MTRLMLLAGVVLAGALCGCSESQPMADRDAAPDVPAAGVPLTLAQDRAARVSDLRYELHVTIPDAVATPVRGTVTLRFELSDASRALALDFAGPAASVRDVRAQGTAVSPTVRDEHVVFPASALRRGANELTLSFDSSDLALNRNPEFMYTLFVPARARLAFPCFDQPDLKARYQLTLDVPAGWETIANGAEQQRTAERIEHPADLCRNPSDLDLSVRVRRGTVLGGDRRTRWAPAADAPSRDRRREGGSQPRRDLRSARGGARRGSRSTPRSRIRSTSSTSCWCRRSSSAAWSIPARSSTTRRPCCSIRRRRRTSSSGAPA